MRTNEPEVWKWLFITLALICLFNCVAAIQSMRIKTQLNRIEKTTQQILADCCAR